MFFFSRFVDFTFSLDFLRSLEFLVRFRCLCSLVFCRNCQYPLHTRHFTQLFNAHVKMNSHSNLTMVHSTAPSLSLRSECSSSVFIWFESSGSRFLSAPHSKLLTLENKSDKCISIYMRHQCEFICKICQNVICVYFVRSLVCCCCCLIFRCFFFSYFSIFRWW